MVAVMAVGGFLMFGNKAESQSGGLESSDGRADIGNDIVVTLNQLQNLKINSDFFKTPIYLSLFDFSKAVIPEPLKRPNPFAPIGRDTATPTAPATTAPAATTAPRTTTTQPQAQTQAPAQSSAGDDFFIGDEAF